MMFRRTQFKIFKSIRSWFVEQNWKRLAVTAFVVILIALLARDGYLLFRHNVAVGIDGYYYVLQIEALRNNHALYFPTKTPLVLYLLTAISYGTNSPVTSIKVAALLLHALLCLGIFALVANALCSRWLGVLASAMAAVSGIHLYLVAEFISLLGSLTFLVWSGWFGLRWIENRTPISMGAAVAFAVAALFSHQLAIAILLLGIICLFLLKELTRAKSDLRFVIAVATAAIVYVAPAIIKVQSVVDLPDRLRMELATIPQWPITSRLLPEAPMLAILSLAAVILLFGPMRAQATSVSGTVVGLIAIFSLLVTLNPFLNEQRGWVGIVGRVRGLAYFQVALLTPGLVWLLFRRWQKVVIYLLAFLPPLAILSILAPLPYGMRSEYLTRREQLVHQLPQFRTFVRSDSIIVAAHGDQFLISSMLGIASQQFAPNPLAYSSVYWLLDQPKQQTILSQATAIAEHSASRTVLIEDTALEIHLRSIPDFERQTLLRLNQHLRTAYSGGEDESTLR